MGGGQYSFKNVTIIPSRYAFYNTERVEIYSDSDLTTPIYIFKDSTNIITLDSISINKWLFIRVIKKYYVGMNDFAGYEVNNNSNYQYWTNGADSNYFILKPILAEHISDNCVIELFETQD